MFKKIIIVSLSAILCFLCGCTKDDDTSQSNQSNIDASKTESVPSEAYNYNITSEQSEYKIRVGEVITPKYIISPEEYKGKIRFEVDNESVINVDDNGNVTAVGKGTATLTIYLDNNKKCECHIEVVSAIDIEDITIESDKYMIGTGEEFLLSFEMTPYNADVTDIIFKSDDSEVVKIDSYGNIKAVDVGTANVTLTAPNGKKVGCEITVMSAPTEFELDCDNNELYYGYTTTVKPVFKDGEYSSKITYETDNNNVVEVDSEGNITVKGKGSAVITAKSHNGTEASTEIVVKGVYIESISVENTESIYGVGENHTIEVDLSPYNASLEDVVFTSSNTDIIEVDAYGKCIFKQAGNAVITITASNGKSVSCNITVIKEPSEIYLNCSQDTLYRNQGLQLTTSFNPDERKSDVIYSSSDNSVVTVDSNGKIKALSKGTAIITATVYNGVKDSVTITVDDSHTYVDSLKITKPSGFMEIGGTYTLNVNVSPSYTKISDIKFTSSDTNVLTIDTNGKITVKGPGTATINAVSFNGIYSQENISITVVNYSSAYTSQRVYNDINYLVNKYPSIIKTYTIGYSEQGKELPVVVLGNGDKKGCVVAGIHSREHITVSFTMRCIEEYAQAYNSSSGMYGEYNIKELLNEYTLYIVPMINPDGMDISTSTNEPIVYISNLARDKYKCNANGVNLNRNFPFEWDKLMNKPIPSEEYCGSSAASESETQAVIKLCEENEFEWLLDMHIVGNGIYWKDSKNGGIEGDYEFTRSLANRCGYMMFEVTTDSQSYAGGLENWFRYEYKKPGLCIELIPSSKAYITNTYIGYNKYFEEVLVWNKTKYTFAEAMSFKG